MFINQRGFSAIEIVLVIIVIAALGFAGWMGWQTQQDGSENVTSQQIEKTDEASEESAELEEAQEAEPATKKSHPSFATGQVLFKDNGNAHITVLVNNSMREEPLKSIWVEYGQDKTKLSNTSEKDSTHLAYNTMNSYGGFTIVIPASKLESNSMYFYRAVGETRGNETIYGGVAGFTNK